jgi:protein SCO1/2
MNKPPRSMPAAAMVAVLLLAAACAPSHKFNGQVLDADAAPPRLVGVNWDAKPFDLADLKGSVAVVFFGYSYCPDVCPMTLAKMKQVVSRLGDRADDLAVVFVSVDPYRDSVDKLADYVPSFDQRFYGVRLEQEQLDKVQEEFGLAVQYGQPKDGPSSDTFYYVDHTGSYFLFDRSGALRLRHPPNATVDEILPDLEALLAS